MWTISFHSGSSRSSRPQVQRMCMGSFSAHIAAPPGYATCLACASRRRGRPCGVPSAEGPGRHPSGSVSATSCGPHVLNTAALLSMQCVKSSHLRRPVDRSAPSLSLHHEWALPRDRRQPAGRQGRRRKQCSRKPLGFLVILGKTPNSRQLYISGDGKTRRKKGLSPSLCLAPVLPRGQSKLAAPAPMAFAKGPNV